MIDVFEGPVSTMLLYGNVIVFATFLLYYGLREPWRRNWFGWAIILLLVGVLQLSVRALFTSAYGEDYPGRELVLMLGRLELFASGLALLVALVRMRHHHRHP